ncbi:MAG: dihydroorotase [Firmicutes bacterium]|jgi:dihydroorotase|nr:dihydroorotase [Bacillota bacterium]
MRAMEVKTKDLNDKNELDKYTITIPTFVDVHVHLREPGFFYKETIKTGTNAAAKSGYSHLFAMPNLNPVPDSLENLNIQLEIIKRDALINVIPYGSITMGEKGRTLANFQEMTPFVAGFSDDGVGVENEEMMEKAMAMAKSLDKIIVAHCEDMSLRDGGYIHAGNYAKEHGHKGICSESEWKPIERDLKLAAKTGCSYHVCHVSAKESVAIIREAKKAGIDVTCETAPHYLTLNDGMLKDEGRFKMNPPIRGEKDREALIEGILDGTIDMIATDHAPHSLEEKSKGLRDSAMGITGLETAFPILYTKLVKAGILTLDKLIELMSTNPRKRFGLTCSNTDKEYAVWDIGTEYSIDSETFESMGKSTPFDGWRVYGKCLKTVVNNKTVWSI